MKDRTRVRTYVWQDTQPDVDLDPPRHPKWVRLGHVICLASAAVSVLALTWAWGNFVAWMVSP